MRNISSELVYNELIKLFPNPKCELNFSTPFEIMCAVCLSAQCTDKRVNLVTPKLFRKYPTSKELSNASIIELEGIIKPCGMYHQKAKNLILASKRIEEVYNGVLPNSLDELQTLAGVGRKSANVIKSVAFQGDAIAVDTHVFRVSNRLGIAISDNVFDCEKKLMEFFPQSIWSNSHYLMVLFGRYICKARTPDCYSCPLKDVCLHNEKQQKNKP